MMENKCEHDWKGAGLNTVSDPVTMCWYCPKCKWFRLIRRYDDRTPEKNGKIMSEVYLDEWPFGFWDWSKFENKKES